MSDLERIEAAMEEKVRPPCVPMAVTSPLTM